MPNHTVLFSYKSLTVNSPVTASNPTWIVCSKSEGREISGRSFSFFLLARGDNRNIHQSFKNSDLPDSFQFISTSTACSVVDFNLRQNSKLQNFINPLQSRHCNRAIKIRVQHQNRVYEENQICCMCFYYKTLQAKPFLCSFPENELNVVLITSHEQEESRIWQVRSRAHEKTGKKINQSRCTPQIFKFGLQTRLSLCLGLSLSILMTY